MKKDRAYYENLADKLSLEAAKYLKLPISTIKRRMKAFAFSGLMDKFNPEMGVVWELVVDVALQIPQLTDEEVESN